MPCLASRIFAIIGMLISERYSQSPVTKTTCGFLSSALRSSAKRVGRTSRAASRQTATRRMAGLLGSGRESNPANVTGWQETDRQTRKKRNAEDMDCVRDSCGAEKEIRRVGRRAVRDRN